jgi:hypothetical protein
VGDATPFSQGIHVTYDIREERRRGGYGTAHCTIFRESTKPMISEWGLLWEMSHFFRESTLPMIQYYFSYKLGSVVV